MRSFSYLVYAALIGLLALPAWGQSVSSSPLGGNTPMPVALSAALQPSDAHAGEGAQVVVTVKIDPGYHIYSLTQPQNGAVPTTIELASGGPLTGAGKAVEPAYKVDSTGLQEYEQSVSFGVPVTVKVGLTGAQTAHVSVRYQVCDAHRCLFPKTVDLPVAFTVAPGPVRPDHKDPVTAVPTQSYAQVTTAPNGNNVSTPAAGPQARSESKDETSANIARAEHQGLFAFIALAFGAGFLALLTPCVFPMVPITVSFFAKRNEKANGKGVRDALAYCLGIIGTFTVLGVATAVIFKATGIRVIANNPFLNLALAVLFIVLGVNLMGAFEIVLPTALANRAQAGAQRSGVLGPILMGLTFTLTSFTCTVAFVGTLLATAAQGSIFYPIVGMLAFSTAFASPFFLLAMFPQYLARLPKSGSWLVTVKAFMGFVELAAALKFLSNADLVWNRGLLTRPVFLAIWATLAIIAGLYLLGWLRLPHDDTIRIGPGRRGLAVVTLILGIWFLAGINGASLGQLTDFLPPDPYPGRAGRTGAELPWLRHYDQALAQAKSENRPLLINFTGVNCTNCRDMELHVFSRPDVQAELANFVRAELFTDRQLAEDERNAQLMQQLTGVATLPVYAVLSPDGKVQKVLQDRHSPADFIAFLRQAW